MHLALIDDHLDHHEQAALSKRRYWYTCPGEHAINQQKLRKHSHNMLGVSLETNYCNCCTAYSLSWPFKLSSAQSNNLLISAEFSRDLISVESWAPKATKSLLMADAQCLSDPGYSKMGKFTLELLTRLVAAGKQFECS